MLHRSERLSGALQRSGEVRSPFQRDRDRILYSAHLRRLGGITQVTTPSELHAFHNRLTHTLEVAQVARRIAERAHKLYGVSLEEIDPDVCESAALAHDLGHPPFGHSGEAVLNDLAAGRGAYQPTELLEDGYEGNAQTLRILLKLAVRSGDARGLDLTAATLRATLKYPWLKSDKGENRDKYGVFTDEKSDFEKIWTGLPPKTPTLEAQIMDWADDVAYSTHDFYDFALAGLIPLGALKVIGAGGLRELVSADAPASGISDRAFELVAQSFQALPSPPLSNASRLTSKCVGLLKVWVSFQIGRCAGEFIRFGRENDEIRFEKLESIQEEVAILKALTYHCAIGSPALAIRREGERRVLTTLFEILYDTAAGRKTGLLSEESLTQIEEGTSPTRVVLDVLSSMTDAQAVSLYHKLTGIAPISILDVTTSSPF
jgi:dGTPase